jgi:hypothetical protein
MQSDQKDAMIESLIDAMKPQLKEAFSQIVLGVPVVVFDFSLMVSGEAVPYKIFMAHELTGIVLKSVLDGMQLAQQRGEQIQQQQSKLVRPS